MKIFGQHVPLPILLLAAAEFASAGVAFLVSASLLLSTMAVEHSPPLLAWAALFATAVLIGLTAMGLYQAKQRYAIEGVLIRVVLALLAAVVCSVLLNNAFPLHVDGRIWMLTCAGSFGLLAVSRVTFSKLVDLERFRRRVLVFGAGHRASSLLQLRRRSDQRGFRIQAFVPSEGDRFTIDDARVVEPPASLLEFARKLGVNEIVVAADDRRCGFPIKDLLECKFAGIRVVDLLAFLERETGKVKVDLVNPGWLIFSDGFASKASNRIASRAMDMILATLLLLAALPIMAVVAAAICVQDGRPVFYRQTRVGLNGRHFTLYKFRSMVKDAESDGLARWAGSSDARITFVGRVIRRLRLDELPQLFNVFRGDMALVGPRPERPEFVDSLAVRIPYYHERHTVKPGITGWAQMRYPYGSSERDALEKLHFDLYYVKHKSIIFDVIVLLQTVEVVFSRKGAR